MEARTSSLHARPPVFPNPYTLACPNHHIWHTSIPMLWHISRLVYVQYAQALTSPHTSSKPPEGCQEADWLPGTSQAWTSQPGWTGRLDGNQGSRGLDIM